MTVKIPEVGTSSGSLSFMQRLSPYVFLYKPSPPDNEATTVTATPSKADPALVLLFGWMNAGNGPLAKYVRQYQVLFPTSAIILVTCSFPGMMFPQLGSRRARLVAATTREILEEDETRSKAKGAINNGDGARHPRLLIHAFSNAGSTMLCHTYKAYATTSSSDELSSSAIPLHVSIFDSMPVPFIYKYFTSGIIGGVPSKAGQIVAAPIIYLFAFIVWLLLTFARVPDHIGVLPSLAHNDPERNREAFRVYMYSPVDTVVSPKTVERHAEEATAKGFRIQREVFADTAHVAHARKYPERYWSIVSQAWQGTQVSSRL